AAGQRAQVFAIELRDFDRSAVQRGGGPDGEELGFHDSGVGAAESRRAVLSWDPCTQHSRNGDGTGHRPADCAGARGGAVPRQLGRTRNGLHAVVAAWRDRPMSAGRIIVVDDDPQIRRVMRVTLTGQGYEVDDVKTGGAAIAKLRESLIDPLLLA